MAEYSNHERSVTEVLREMKAEAQAFINTRVELFLAELREKSIAWKHSLPMLAAAVIFGMGTFATLTFTLVSVITGIVRTVAAPDSVVTNFAWAIGAVIVCVCYGCAAAILARTGYKRLTAQSMMPERTLRVLRQDQQWIKDEARAA